MAAAVLLGAPIILHAIKSLIQRHMHMDELVARRASPRELREAAVSKGFRSLADEGLQRVVEGVTSLSEVARAIDLTSRAQ